VLIKPLFRKDSSLTLRVIFVGLIAVLVLLVDYKTQYLKPLKSSLVSLSQPLFTFVNIPRFFADWGEHQLVSREELQLENTRLEADNLVLQAKLQQFAALTIENVRLRELLNSTKLLEENVLVAEIIAVSPDPLLHYVMLNKGLVDDVFVGQAVIDANGLFGQVMEVATTTSRVLLISDVRHAVPVQVSRNGVRLIAEGIGDFSELSLPHVAMTTDIVEGDVLITSGLGEVFPLGYPVARVKEVRRDTGLTFAIVKAQPYAHIDRARHVLLLFEEGNGHEGQ
jgi:rod shape-determining protein MreC